MEDVTGQRFGKLLVEWAEFLGVKYHMLYSRVKRGKSICV